MRIVNPRTGEVKEVNVAVPSQAPQGMISGGDTGNQTMPTQLSSSGGLSSMIPPTGNNNSSMEDMIIKALPYMMMADTSGGGKNVPEYNTILSALTEARKREHPELTATERAQQKKEQNFIKKADDVLTQAEKKYFQSGLYYGFGQKGFLEKIKAFNPNHPLNIYKSFLNSKGVSLAKAAGDTGNIAYQEQVAQLKSLPLGLEDYDTAVEKFNMVREGFGLPTKDYSQYTKGKSKTQGLIPSTNGRPSLSSFER